DDHVQRVHAGGQKVEEEKHLHLRSRCTGVGEVESRHQMPGIVKIVFGGLDGEEHESERDRCAQEADQGPAFTELGGAYAECHGQAAREKHAGVDAAESDIGETARAGKNFGITEASDGVGRKKYSE